MGGLLSKATILLYLVLFLGKWEAIHSLQVDLPVWARFQAQEDLPTPTTTVPQGMAVATVIIGDNPEINVRSGPGVEFISIGKLQAGQSVPALGRSPGGDWVQIVFPDGPGGVGWVYAYLVTVTGNLPVVEPPSTPTPRVTPTIDPTLAAQFIREIPPTRLPTFTAPPPLSIPTFTEQVVLANPQGRPILYIMVLLAVIGVLSALLSLIRVR
jgi:hypothetical protein